MCGRFTLRTPQSVLIQQFRVGSIPLLSARYNIAPTQQIGVVRQLPGQQNTPQREFTWMSWGLVPRWAKDPKLGSQMINARAETVATKPAFRDAFRSRRCLIVADGFYEWQQHGSTKRGVKQPHYIRLRDGQPFAFAGLWEQWRGAANDMTTRGLTGDEAIDIDAIEIDEPSHETSPLETCTIITTAANALLATMHERMPVILSPNDYERWLDPQQQDIAELQPLLDAYPADEMIAEPVSTRVNSVRNDGPECIQTAPEERLLF